MANGFDAEKGSALALALIAKGHCNIGASSR
jgi:hypothetical protein